MSVAHPTAPTGPVDLRPHRRALAEQGFTVVPDAGPVQRVVDTLERLGRLVPQYDGRLTHEVQAVTGFEDRSFSKSTNTIRAHTEAPGWDPPPRYLALHCHTQARCGGGHTDVADGLAFLAELDPSERALLEATLVDFPVRKPGSSHGRAFVRKPLADRQPDGRVVLRFSTNLLSTGDYDPPLDASAPAAKALPLGRYGAELSGRVNAFFARRRTPVLVPEGSLLIWDNSRMLHARSAYRDRRRHLTRYWVAEHPA